jgi:hypothetical protein
MNGFMFFPLSGLGDKGNLDFGSQASPMCNIIQCETYIGLGLGGRAGESQAPAGSSAAAISWRFAQSPKKGFAVFVV